jgi:hypothetical protein
MHRHVCQILHGFSDVLSQILQVLKPSLTPRSINPCYIGRVQTDTAVLAPSLLATDQVSAMDGSRMAGLPGSPHTTLSPPSRKPVLPSFELPQRDTHSSRRRLDSSWVVSSLRPAALHSASAAGTA